MFRFLLGLYYKYSVEFVKTKKMALNFQDHFFYFFLYFAITSATAVRLM